MLKKLYSFVSLPQKLDNPYCLIIRVTNADGNMNPKIDSFDIVPDKNLERLTNLCETIVEEMDEHFLELFADEKNSPVIEQKICVEESGYCKDLKDEL